MSELDKLIEAVEGGDAIAAIGHAKTITIKARDKGEIWPGFDVQKAMLRNDLNAAKALHDALLPGWDYRIETGRRDIKARVSQPHLLTYNDPSSAETPARAWLLAVLRAYRATQEPKT